MNVVFGYAFRIDVEGLRVAGAPRAFVREVIDFLEVDQDRHLQFRRERVHAAQLGSVGGDVELQLAEPLRAVLDRLREHLLGIRLRDVVAVEPGEAARRGRLHRFHPIERRRPRQQVGLGDTGAVDMREIGGRLRPEMKVQVEDGTAPLVRGRSLACERRQDGGSGDRLEEGAAIHATSPVDDEMSAPARRDVRRRHQSAAMMATAAPRLERKTVTAPVVSPRRRT